LDEVGSVIRSGLCYTSLALPVDDTAFCFPRNLGHFQDVSVDAIKAISLRLKTLATGPNKRNEEWVLKKSLRLAAEI
jgi:hypothetical protein